MEPASTLRRPELDGLRGAAIVLVVVSHALNYGRGDSQFRGLGSAGVSLFFALSGFLITSLICAQPRLSRFYRNRAVRLLPALAFAILGYWALQTSLQFELIPGVGWVVGYLANWAQISGHDLGALDPTWSLSVEEQFYFVWPLLLVATRRQPRVQFWCTVCMLACTSLARFSLFPLVGELHVYMGSETASASLLVGSLLALVVRRGIEPLRIPVWLVVVGSASMLMLAAFASSPWGYTVIVPTAASWWGCVLIWTRTPLTWRPLRYAGARSYAVYLWHNGILWMTLTVAGPSLVSMAVGVAISFGIAEVSWHLVEQPARRRWHESAGAHSHTASDLTPLDPAPGALEGHGPLAQFMIP